METLGSRLKAAREAKGLNQSQLAREIKATSQAVNRWEHDANPPCRDMLFKLARVLSVPVMWLMFGGALPEQEGNNSSLPSSKHRMVPMLKSSDTTIELPTVGQHTAVPTHFPCGDQAFAVEVPNDSNDPKFPQGSRWIIDPDAQPAPGRMGLASYGVKRAPVFGEFRFETSAAGQVTILAPLNQKWPAARSDLDVLEILGVMTEAVIRG